MASSTPWVGHPKRVSGRQGGSATGAATGWLISGRSDVLEPIVERIDEAHNGVLRYEFITDYVCDPDGQQDRYDPLVGRAMLGALTEGAVKDISAGRFQRREFQHQVFCCQLHISAG